MAHSGEVRIVASLVLALAMLVVSPPAYAAPGEIGNGACNAGNVCMWQYSGQSGSLADARTCEPDWYCGLRDLSEWYYFNTTVSPNDRTSSIWVRSADRPWAMFAQHQQGGGIKICVSQGVHLTQAELNAVSMNDRISSMWTELSTEC